MAAKVVGLVVSKLIVVVGFLFCGVVVAYAQSVTDAIRVADAVTKASADNPLLAVIKIMALLVAGSLALSAWLVRIVMIQTSTQAQAVSKFDKSPCVLAHANPQLYAKLLEGGHQ